MDQNLTPKQLRVLTRIREIRVRKGCSPTMQELADELGVSKVTVFEHVQALIRKRALTRRPNRARSLEVNPKFSLPSEESGQRLPLLGAIAAGSPIEAVEDRDYLDLGELFASKGQEFVLKVRGDSMIEDQICDGDFVVCRKAERVHDGQTVVALLDSGEATLKRYYREGAKVRLQPANARYQPIMVKARECQVQGVVVGVIRAL